MATTPITDLYAHTVPDLRAVSKPILLNTIRDAIIEWCEETFAWTCELDLIKLVAAEDTYDLNCPSYARIIAVTYADVDGQELDPVEDYVQPSHGEIKLAWEPTANSSATDSTKGLTVEVALKPKSDADVVDRCLYEDHYRTWAHGALWRMMSKTGKPWSDPAGAMLHEREFSNSIAAERIKQLKGGLPNALLKAQAPFPFLPGSVGAGRSPFHF